MKALSVKQPWADLIVSGLKDIENRTWRTHFRGRIQIHASQKFASVGFNSVGGLRDLLTGDQLDAVGWATRKDLLRGRFTTSAIIGEVDIVDCVQNHPSVWAEQGVWNWVLSKAIMYDEPILNVKGGLSFWQYTPII
jgi:hypothetical protein